MDIILKSLILDYVYIYHKYRYLHKGGKVRGTLGYIPPETATRAQYSIKNDSWCVGQTIIKMFANTQDMPRNISEMVTQFLKEDVNDRWSVEEGIDFLRHRVKSGVISPVMAPLVVQGPHIVGLEKFLSIYNVFFEENVFFAEINKDAGEETTEEKSSLRVLTKRWMNSRKDLEKLT